MSEISIDDMNSIIAVFDGWEFKLGDPNHKCPYCIGGDEPCTPAVDRFYKWGHVKFHYELKYHSDWSWLMPVVEKIIDIQYPDAESCQDTAWPRTFGMPSSSGGYMVRLNRQPVFTASTLLDATHEAVYQFIQWYNANQKQKEQQP